MAIINCHLVTSLHCWLEFSRVFDNKVGWMASWVGVEDSVQGQVDHWPETHRRPGFLCEVPGTESVPPGARKFLVQVSGRPGRGALRGQTQSTRGSPPRESAEWTLCP